MAYEDEYQEVIDETENEEENEEEKDKVEEEQNALADSAMEAQQEEQQATLPDQNPWLADAVAETVEAQQPAPQQGQTQGQAQQPAGNQQITPEQALANPEFLEYIRKNDPDQYNQLMALQQAQGQTAGTAQTQSTGNALYDLMDKEKAYGRTGKGGYKSDSYSYSYSGKELQKQLNQEIYKHNRDIASGAKPGTAADYIKPLKEDGLMGYNTMQAMTKLGWDTSKLNLGSGNNSYQAPAQPSQSVDTSTESAPAERAPGPSGVYGTPGRYGGVGRVDADALAEAQAEGARRKAVQDVINGNNNLPEDAPPMQVSNGNNSNQNLSEALSALALNAGAQVPQNLNGEAAELEAAYQANAGAPVYGEPRNGSVPNRYSPDEPKAEPEAPQGTAPVYGSPRYGGVTERATWDNYNDVAMNQQLAELEREWNANNGREATGEVYGEPRNGGVPDRYSGETSEYTIYDSPIGPTMPEPTGVYGTPGNRGVPNRFQAELEQMQEPQGQVYGSQRNGSVPERYVPPVEETPSGTAPVYGTPRYGGVTERATWDNYNDIAMQQQLAELQREWESNAPTGEVYGTPRNGSVPERFMSPQERTFSPETVAPDDVQSSGEVYGSPRNGGIPERYTEPNTESTQSSTMRPEGVSQVGDSMSRALADNQSQPNTNIFAQDAPPVISPERENQYKTLFNNEISALSQMYPDASFNQLYDYLRLFYEQNGDTNTEYYRWFNSFL